MKTFELRETSLPNTFKASFETDVKGTGKNGDENKFYITNLDNDKDGRNDCIYPFSIFFSTCATVMSKDKMKNKDHKTALVFSNPKGAGSMLLACISEWIPDESGEDGNFNIFFSFDPDDIKGLPEDAIHQYTDIATIAPWASTFSAIMADTHRRLINDEEIINSITILIVKSLNNWLEENASESDVISIEFKEAANYSAVPENGSGEKYDFEEYKKSWITYATASVEVVKGKKVKSITFGEELKAIAKGNVDSI